MAMTATPPTTLPAMMGALFDLGGVEGGGVGDGEVELVDSDVGTDEDEDEVVVLVGNSVVEMSVVSGRTKWSG